MAASRLRTAEKPSGSADPMVTVIVTASRRFDSQIALSAVSVTAFPQGGVSEDTTTLAASPAAVDVRIPTKTSLILATRHEEGALLRCLEVLSGSGHSMTKLESRPRPGRPWEYVFFLECEGHQDDPKVKKTLAAVQGECEKLYILGSFPVAPLTE